MIRAFSILCTVCVCLSGELVSRAESLASGEVARVYPPAITLNGRRDSQLLVVQQVRPSGLTEDITANVKIEVADDSVAKIVGASVLPVGDGDTVVTATVEGRALSVPVRVRHAADDSPLSFRLDVMPIFSKATCNTGRCHGSARGQDGFRLSLYGFDAAGDYYRLTREFSGRRINLARPAASLLLKKATGTAPHTGGELFATDSPFFDRLLRWLHEGARDDEPGVAKPTGIEIFPPEAVFDGEDCSQQLVVVASYSDGTTRDVTSLCTFLSNNDNSADVDASGRIRAGARGEAFVMARFATFTEGVPVITLPAGLKHTFPDVPEFNYIDRLVYEKLRKLRITPSEVCSDERFVRRLYIDLVGVTPTVEQFQQFVADNDPSKRARLVDELLEREEFVDLWTMKFGELLKIRTANQVSYKALLGFHHWVRDQVAAGAPLNKLVADVIAAEGGTFESPATNYYQIEANTRQLAENVAQSFLGMRIQCAQCHNHPFDRWTMDDYYGFNAFFSQIDFKQSRDPREFVVYSRGEGEVYHIVDNRAVAPKFLGGETPKIGSASRREVLADWMQQDAAGGLSRHLANLIWAHHFGRGIIDPVDDVRISNPAANAKLLDELSRRLRDYGYQLKTLVRDICLSRTYQLSTQANETNRDDFRNFAKAELRRIRAEVLLDSISQITGTQDRFARLPEDARSIQIADGAVSNYFLTTFGRARRETVCSCEVDVEPTLSQAFHLLNGETTNNKIAAGSLVAEMLEKDASPADVIERIYLRCYSRRPTEAERLDLLATISAEEDLSLQLNDIFWAVLNSKEFMFNH